MANVIVANTEELRAAAELLKAEGELFSQALKTYITDSERLGRPWGTGEIGDAFGPPYLKNRQDILDAAEKIAKRLLELARVGGAAYALEAAEHENILSANG
jgi:hypothetical protein